MESNLPHEDTVWTRLAGPVGMLTAMATTTGLLRLSLVPPLATTVQGAAVSGREVQPSEHPWLALLDQELAQYLGGTLRTFSVPLDWSLVSGARLSVLRTLAASVAYGQTTSYGELAAATGRPGAARFVGNAMAANPLPILVPCHRVLTADGSLGGYNLGQQAKHRLLELEGTLPRKRGSTGGWS
ncbi:MAG: methylated-DNA--[protein]-cysteine S-methyltransferase [Dactylosporangium sp.]|nr:methylated-DNA--[protein]-cysteine S-methyltransferase [Dactylosporangium sp.]NNJ59392.1 methylated-DNA--[protein]-cysteine S-methyltransferase [Dactylosporangium sp.]